MLMQVAAVGNLFFGSPPAAWSLAIIIGGFMYLNPSSGGLSVPVTKNRNFSLYLLGSVSKYCQNSLIYDSLAEYPLYVVCYFRSLMSISLRPPEIKS